ncbi:uncharacterized protein LOC111064236 isoform X2 [Nilaparvata lugens]|uniref:uncharacterized protein LOC111064236 isoform X2 n=2 Tax=Nilaparvata lugens TaxID=108931 RepID=UPI00193E6AF2|nr:uncharacterized protein LOC111064236 isoform X2 [Nilaparvata lugens]XP_039289721.1 uncharacterized protein LOC111064236 isoform X2 [Nilaparvata lugens]
MHHYWLEERCIFNEKSVSTCCSRLLLLAWEACICTYVIQMFGNPQRYKVSLQRLENRHATAGCLLALLFSVPLLARAHSMLIIGPLVMAYVTVAVPLAAGYFTLGDLFSSIKKAGGWLQIRLINLTLLLQWLHNVYLHLENIHTTTNQVFFNMLVEKVICPDQRFSCLYVLLFYTVLAYLHQSLKKRQWSQVLNETSTTDFIRLTTAFVVARLGKAVVMGLVLLTFSLQFNHLEPPFLYVLITLLYFLLSQYPGTPGDESKAVLFVRQFEVHELEGLEEWYIPLSSRLICVITSLLFIPLGVISNSHWILATVVSYTNVLIPWMRLVEECWRPLSVHRLSPSVYPVATVSDLNRIGEQVCAICLDGMRPLSSRVTPCNHVFHAHCLRKCIKQFRHCPLCKHVL